MIRKLIAGILFSVIAIPGNGYAASDEDTKKAFESYYGESGYINKLWACELVSRTLIESKWKTTDGTMNYFLNDYSAKKFNDYFKSYLAYESAKTADQWVKEPITEKIYKTIIRDLTASPINQRKFDIVISYCYVTLIDYVVLESLKRTTPSAHDHFIKTNRKFWDKFVLENPAPKIAPLQTEQ